MTSYLQHPGLKENVVERRMFQLELATSALQGSTLVVLPTGLGKTIVALLVILARQELGKVLFMAPTRPLVEQHAFFLSKVLNDESWIVHFTGENPPERRRDMWRDAKVIISTPQVIENDLLSRRIDLQDVSCVIFDEAHRGVGNYAYVYIAERYQRECRDPLVLGITASPGSSLEKIEEVCTNLGIEKVETKTEMDPDVAPFIHNKEIEVVKVSVPRDLLKLRNLLDEVLQDKIEVLGRFEMTGGSKSLSRASKKELLNLQKTLRSSIARNPHPGLYQAVSVLAEVMKLKHAVELAETQGVDSLTKYMERLEMEAKSRGGSKASQRIMEDPKIKEVIFTLERLDVDHPKLIAVRELVKEELHSKDDSRIMVFTNYRDTASSVLQFLEECDDDLIRPVRFVGQSSRVADEGLTQKKQTEILTQFREGQYNVLIATSVGEEGIDIPATDMVIFYEPVPSEIRSIQRKGRTGRAREGRVVVLVARGTRDEAYRWISSQKERNMQRQIQEISWSNKSFSPGGEAKQIQISEVNFSVPEPGEEESALISVDPRERGMAKRLEAMGVGVVLKNLEVGDYVISDRVAIERKTAADFVDSLVDPERGLFGQISDLARNYEKPVLILEGRDFYVRQVNPQAIRGALISIALDFGVPVVPTENEEETASVIALMARREQEERSGAYDVHGKKTHRTLKEQQEYILSSIPGVGPMVAQNLLKHFDSVKRVITASQEELVEVDLVGPKTAERIREVVSGAYKG